MATKMGSNSTEFEIPTDGITYMLGMVLWRGVTLIVWVVYNGDLTSGSSVTVSWWLKGHVEVGSRNNVT